MTDKRLFEKRVYLFAGHYGSGKTEVAVNFAMELSRRGRTAIADFDVVNPFFRTAGARRDLESRGIRVVAPVYANTNVDVPALPAEIYSLFDDKTIKAVFDVGGDAAGARAVSRYRDEFMNEDAANFFVFNIRRPMTSSVEEAAEAFRDIQACARLPFTALVNNTNLLGETCETDLLEGLEAAVSLSRALSLPVAFSARMRISGTRGGAAGKPAGKTADKTAGKPAGLPTGCGASDLFAARSAELGIPVFEMSKYIHMDYI